MKTKLEKAAEALGDLAQRHFPVASLTTYKVGGTAALFCRADEMSTLQKVSAVCQELSVEMVVIGRGSNSLFCDAEFEGDVTFQGDIAIKGKSIKESLLAIEERLAILRPNEKLEEKWDNLRELRKQYMELEAEIIEKEKMWAILKK